MPLLTLNELEQASALFRGKCGNALCRRRMRMLSIDKVNDLYDHNSSVTGPDFAEAVLEDIGVKYEVLNNDVLKQLPDGPFITISNHPYGHIDGVMLVDLFGHIRPDFKVMVNKFLGRIENLKDNFICVTPTGTERTGPTKESIQGIKEAVVPVHFFDRNSNFYYSLGLVDWKVRLLRLPAEVFNKRGKVTRISLGEIILPEQLQKYESIDELSDFLRNKVYNQY